MSVVEMNSSPALKVMTSGCHIKRGKKKKVFSKKNKVVKMLSSGIPGHPSFLNV